MEGTMDDIVFDDKSNVPDDNDLQEALEDTKKLWDELTAYIKDTYDSVKEEWKFYGKKYGWQMKLPSKKRNIMFLIPRKGYFLAVFVFGEKAVEAIINSSLDQSIITAIKEARKYAEGRGLKIEVKSEKDIDNIKTLAHIKINN
jgi:hypothetical protein